MPKPRTSTQNAVYIMRPCRECGVDDLNQFHHEPTCPTLGAKIERGEEPSDGEVLAHVVADWRKKNKVADPAGAADPEPSVKPSWGWTSRQTAEAHSASTRCTCPSFPWNPLRPMAHRDGCPAVAAVAWPAPHAPEHPMQPIVIDGKVARFRENKLVKLLLDRYPGGLNSVLFTEPRPEDLAQLLQLLGYSVSAWGSDCADLIPEDQIARADALVQRLTEETKES